MDGKHPARSRLQLPAGTFHQEAAMGPAEACQAVLAVGGGEDEVPWGEGGVSAPSRGFGNGRAESNLLPSLPVKYSSRFVQKGQFLVNQSKDRLPKKKHGEKGRRKMSPLARPMSPGCRAGRSALTMHTLWPGCRGGRRTGATLAEGTTPWRSSREHSTQ